MTVKKYMMERYGVVSNINEIEFDFIEYTNFINQGYKPFACDWIRTFDDKIIYNPNEILDDFINSRQKFDK